MLAYCYCYVYICYLIRAVLHEVRPYGGEGRLVVSMSSIMSVMSRESREYIFRGGVGEVMTHYVGRSVEGDEGVVVKVYCFARC